MRHVFAVVLGTATLILCGCGGSTTSVSGKVTYKQKTVVWGTVQLVPSDGISRSADIQPDGTFTFDNVPTGSCKIGVSSPNPDSDSLLSKLGQKGPFQVKGGLLRPAGPSLQPGPGSLSPTTTAIR
jgi:hypothetical protein